MQLNSVVLPAPFGPTSPTLSPASTSKQTLSTAVMPPNTLDTSVTLRSGLESATFIHHRLRLGQRPGPAGTVARPTATTTVGAEEGGAARGGGRFARVEDEALHPEGPAPLLE